MSGTIEIDGLAGKSFIQLEINCEVNRASDSKPVRQEDMNWRGKHAYRRRGESGRRRRRVPKERSRNG
jgi:hypothetical protein